MITRSPLELEEAARLDKQGAGQEMENKDDNAPKFNLFCCFVKRVEVM
jgi:hypothetical protein